MEYILANDLVKVAIKRKGAELCSFTTLNGDFDYVWQAEAAVWARHAPILFPIVGKLKGNSYQYKGHTYHLPQHGFARDMDFEQRLMTTTEASFRLSSSEATRTNYPFDFHLDVSYKLEDTTLHITWQVTNTGQEEMLFSIGAHPGFNIMLNEGETLSDYYLLFEKPETLPLYALEAGLIAGVKQPAYINNSRRLDLFEGIFDLDALVFPAPRSNSITLCNKAGDYKLVVGCEDFTYLGIWSKPGEPFVCIEPWLGVADSTTSLGYLAEKPGIIALEAGGIFKHSHYIRLEV